MDIEETIVKETEDSPEQSAQTISNEILAKPVGIHGPYVLPQPLKTTTNLIVQNVAGTLHEKHEAVFIVNHALAGEYDTVPQMLLLQYYKSMNRPRLAWFIPPSYLKDLVSICVRLYYNLTYRYEKSEIDTTEQAIKAEASQNQNAGVEVDLGGSLLKAILQWKYAISSMQGISFLKRFQITDAQKREYQQTPMTEVEALNILDRKLDSLNTFWAVFCWKPIEPDSADTSGIWLEGIEQWFMKTLVWKFIDWILTLPYELYKVLRDLARFSISKLPVSQNFFGKKKFRVMFVIYGFDSNHPKAEKLRKQFDNIVTNSNAVVLLVNPEGS